MPKVAEPSRLWLNGETPLPLYMRELSGRLLLPYSNFVANFVASFVDSKTLRSAVTANCHCQLPTATAEPLPSAPPRLCER